MSLLSFLFERSRPTKSSKKNAPRLDVERLDERVAPVIGPWFAGLPTKVPPVPPDPFNSAPPHRPPGAGVDNNLLVNNINPDGVVQVHGNGRGSGSLVNSRIGIGVGAILTAAHVTAKSNNVVFELRRGPSSPLIYPRFRLAVGQRVA